MNQTAPNLGTENQSPYQVDSRREILVLLRDLQESKQLINMIINEGAEVIITAILGVDDVNNVVILDCASSETANQRIVESPRVYFEGSLNRISIQFSSASVSLTTFEGGRALRCPIPASVIRLQRREYYRINTPVTSPIMCLIPVPEESGGGVVKFPLVDISCGGIAALDERRLLNTETGVDYERCQLDLPGIGLISVSLQVRNAQNLVLMNHKTSRRVGFQFVDLSQAVIAQIQRLIIKIERERNARNAGLQ